jgi:hypothetical protein
MMCQLYPTIWEIAFFQYNAKRMMTHIPVLDIPSLYRGFNVPISREDCGKKCSLRNPTGKPFCCDICQAVPVAYWQEWDYLSANTDMWHEWRGDECSDEPVDPDSLRAETPEHLMLLACKGPALCQREFRATSCRQFPFFPYITSDYRFIGLAYYWDFELLCWVISNLEKVTSEYRLEFITTFDGVFDLWPEEFESYAAISEEARDFFAGQKRRFPVLHRNGGMYAVSPSNEKLHRLEPGQIHRFGPYSE